MSPEKARGLPGWGVDADPAVRPGVPMELEPEVRGGAHWERPERQPPPSVRVLRRRELPELTPVFSEAIPPRGLSGLIGGGPTRGRRRSRATGCCSSSRTGWT